MGVSDSRLDISTNSERNGISKYQNLSLGVDNQKQIKFEKLKMSLLFNGSLNTLPFSFIHSVVYYFSLDPAPKS